MLEILDCLPTFYYVTFIAPLTMFFDMLMRCYSITDVILMPYSKRHIHNEQLIPWCNCAQLLQISEYVNMYVLCIFSNYDCVYFVCVWYGRE